MKVALYARVSTDDKEQTVDTQLFHLKKIAEAHGYEVVQIYTDTSSGRTIKGRSGYQMMLRDAEKHHFDAIMAYKLDRLHRNTLDCLVFINSMRVMGVDLIITSQAIDTSTAMGRAMMQMIAVLAELESANTAERVKIGLERAKSEGKVCHRQKTLLSDYQVEKARDILAKDPNISQRKLAEQFIGISRPVLIRELKALGILPEKSN